METVLPSGFVSDSQAVLFVIFLCVLYFYSIEMNIARNMMKNMYSNNKIIVANDMQ